MKIAIVLVVLVLAVGGGFAGLLYGHVIKTDNLAKSSPAAASVLKSMGLYKPATVKPAPALQASAVKPKRVVLARQKVDIDRLPVVATRLETRQPQQQLAAAPIPSAPVMPFSSKLTDIYDSMNADDLANIFAKQADSEVVRALQSMDERKAGKVLSALPPDRAAKVASLLARTPDPASEQTNSGQT